MTKNEAKKELAAFLDKVVRLRDDTYTLRGDVFEEGYKIVNDEEQKELEQWFFEIYEKLVNATIALEKIFYGLEDMAN